jgi:fucose permease
MTNTTDEHGTLSTGVPSENNSLWVFLSLVLTYVIFAILLNSVGTVILQSIETFSVTKTQASVLEGFKDLPIAIVSFFVASSLPRFGFKKALIAGLGIVTLASLLMPIVGSFWMTKLLFLSVGVSFALAKVSVYAMLGHISDNSKQHASKMNTLEGCFMLGVLSGYWLFSLFINAEDPASPEWLNVYGLLSAMSAIALIILLLVKFPDTRPEPGSEKPIHQSFLDMLKLALLPFVIMFVISAFFYVVIEQGVGTWLPTFNKSVLGLSNQLSVQITSVFAACLAIGRLSAGVILRKVDWFPFLLTCIVAMALLLMLVIPMTQGIDQQQIDSWQAIPFAAFLLPLIGLFMAPIYPAINSVVLSALPKQQHASMTGLIAIFSALGGTLGSLATGIIFDNFDGQTAFYFMLLPMAILVGSLFFYRRLLPEND